MKNKQDLEIIGFILVNGRMEIANPCSVDIDYLIEILKDYKKKKPKKNETTYVGLIQLNFKLPKKKKEATRRWKEKNIEEIY